jgi:hypothetical protein
VGHAAPNWTRIAGAKSSGVYIDLIKMKLSLIVAALAASVYSTEAKALRGPLAVGARGSAERFIDTRSDASILAAFARKG